MARKFGNFKYPQLKRRGSILKGWERYHCPSFDSCVVQDVNGSVKEKWGGGEGYSEAERKDENYDCHRGLYI